MGSGSPRKLSKLNSPDTLQLLLLIKTGSADIIPIIKSIPNFHKYSVSEVSSIKNQWNLLHLASWYGNHHLCTELIKLGMDSNSVDSVLNKQNRETPLHLAACRGHYKTVKALLPTTDFKNKKNIRGQTPYDIASHAGFCKIAKLIENGVNYKLEISDLE